MSTPYSDIVSLSTLKFKDYKLDRLRVEDNARWETMMEGYLISGLPLFSNCRKSLYDRDEALKLFNETLTDIEIDILSDCMVIKWLERNLNDKLKLDSMIQDKNSAKRVNEPGMLAANRINLAQKMEELNRKLSDYGFSDYLSGVSK